VLSTVPVAHHAKRTHGDRVHHTQNHGWQSPVTLPRHDAVLMLSPSGMSLVNYTACTSARSSRGKCNINSA